MTSGRFLSAGHRLAHTPQSSSCTRPSSKYRLTMHLEVDQWILSASAIVKSSCSGSSNALTKKLAGFLNNLLPSSLRHVQVLNCVHASSLGPEASHLFKASWTMHTLRLSAYRQEYCLHMSFYCVFSKSMIQRCTTIDRYIVATC